MVTEDSTLSSSVAHAQPEPPLTGQIRAGKLAGRGMWSAIGVLSLPVLVQHTMQACVGMVDMILAGSLPKGIVVPALDGLGVGSYVGWFIGIAMTGLGVGGQALIARAIGAGRLHESQHALGQAMMLSVLWGAMVGVLLWFGAPLLGWVTGLSEEAAAHCTQYVRMLAYAMPACGVMMVGAMCLYGAGETTRPALIALAVNVVNVTVSWTLSGAAVRLGETELVSPLGANWHVLGIAAGTAAAYLVGAALTLLVLFHGVRDLKLDMKETTLERDMIRRIVRIGVPSFFEGISMWAVNIFVLVFIGVIAQKQAGNAGLQGAHLIAVQWESFSFLPGFAIGTAAGALAGQYLGAGNPIMARKAILACTGITTIVMSTIGLVFVFAGEWLTSIVSREEIHLTQVPPLLFICGVTQAFFAVTMVVRQGLRGVGDTKWVLIITTVSSYGVRLPAVYVLGVLLEGGLTGVWIALCGELGVRAVLFCSRFFHGGWQRLQL